MKNFSRLMAALLVLAAVFSCGKNTRIEGNLHEGAGREVIVKLLDVNRFQVLDTIKADASGNFAYGLDLKPARPEFIYLFYGDRQIASLLLQKGDRVKVLTDTLGAYSVEGSEESAKLQQVESDYNAFLRDMNHILARETEVETALSRRYVSYYRDRLAYVVGNSHSLTVVPVLFQQVNPSLPVFGQATDGILMRNICDSLKTVYPESRYVTALEKEAKRRLDAMEVDNKLKNAEEVGYIDIVLPGIDGKPQKMSEHLGKVTMLYFWSSTNEQKMFNMDSLIPIYQQFQGKGFEIFAVSLDADKAAWASAVRNQALPWVNVCDTRGAQSPYITAYGIGTLPMAWFIVDGTIDRNTGVRDATTLREYLRRRL